MGLAAGQARLLSITARKSDCEFQSMRLSHQKIALARELADISNEYQNSLNQTKLVYDYYGTGDTSTPLTYSLMMSPSALNDYMPIMLTNSDGRVVLNEKLAAAARKAGIPQEGLGTLPSEELRNNFIQALGSDDVGVISQDLSKWIRDLPYSQGVGFGGGAIVATNYIEGNFHELTDFLNKSGAIIDIEISKADLRTGSGQPFEGTKKNPQVKLFCSDSTKNIDAATAGNGKTSTFNLGDLLSGKEKAAIYIFTNRTGDENSGPIKENVESAIWIIDSIIDQTGDYLSQVLDLGDGYSAAALDYAKNKVLDLYSSTDLSEDSNHKHTNWIGYYGEGDALNGSGDYIGWMSSGKHKSNHNRGEATISINNLLDAYLTYFADYMNGLPATDVYGIEVFEAKVASKDACHLASDNNTFLYKMKNGTNVSSDDLGQATFYDAMFNQICANGWVENSEINSKEYLQEMLQSGKMFVLRINEDNYYYQGNYATDCYIKEIPDESSIAYAEAKYSTEKAKLNSKEETIDLKMKNLDTEISSLTTEYDTVKSTLSKQIENTFKRYSA